MTGNSRSQKRRRAEQFIRFQVSLVKPGEALTPLRILSENSEFGLPLLMDSIKLLIDEGLLEARERSGYFRVGAKVNHSNGGGGVVDIIACSVVHYLDKPDSFNQDLVENLVSTITEKGYSARIHRVNLSDPLSCYADLLKSQNIDKALLLFPHTVEIPRIFIENSIRNVSLYPVFPADYGVQILDNPADLPLLLEHLYKKGHRRISYMGQCEINWTNMERCAAYYRFAAEKGIRIEHSWFIPLSYDRKTLFKNMDAAFSNTKKRPSALVAHDIIFFFLQEYFAERKMAIGKDVSIGLMESSVFGSKYAKHQALGAPLSYLDRNLKGVAELALANLEAGIPGSRENICLYAPSKLIDQHEIHTKNKGGRNETEEKS